RFASTAADAGEDRYAYTDLQALSGLLEGSSKTADVLRPIVIKADPKAFEGIDRDAASIEALLGAAVEGNSYKAYDTLSSDEKAKIKNSAAQLAAQFTKLRD